MINYEYTLIGNGWADVKLNINGQKYFSSVSYISDALGEVLKSLIRIIPECINDDGKYKNIVSFFWHLEPGIDLWTLKVIDDELEIIIDRYEDVDRIFEKYDEIDDMEEIVEVCGNFDDSVGGERLINVKCSLVDFLESIIKACDSLLLEHGFIGYKKSWGNVGFPLENYLRLKFFFKNNTIEGLVSKKNDALSSNIEEELKVLLSLASCPPASCP